MKRNFAALFATLLTLGVASPALAAVVWLQWPVKCTIDNDCLIQNMVDHDPTPGAKDYACNTLTYDGHDGTDIRLLSLSAMRAGVAVLSPADGVVMSVREDMDDKSVRDAAGDVTAGHADVAGRECGNGVRIQHKDKVVTQLCHLRRGSIQVKANHRVKAGEVVGLVGMSGQSEYPHLHITVWRENNVVDPFTRQPAITPCNRSAATSEGYGMWTNRIPYKPSAVINSGFFNAAPTKEAMRDTPVSLPMLPTNAPAITFWVDLLGIQAGDTLQLKITGPDGKVFAENEEKFTKSLAQFFAYIGKRNSSGALMPGRYIASITLKREGTIIPALQSTRTITVQ